MSEITIALLGQPNAGKSTLFNGLTGSRQHVGNWPGKTVEQKEGYFTNAGNKYTIVDLPGTYSLCANSEEEVVTRSYIASGKSDMVCIIVDASQLERSMFMLADYAGITVPVVLVLNMMDVAVSQGKKIDCKVMENKLGIPVVPLSASDIKNYDEFYKAIEKAAKSKPVLDYNTISKVFGDIIGDDYNNLVSLLPSDGIETYSSVWLAAKLVENDSLVVDIIKEKLKQEDFKKLSKIFGSIESGSLLTGEGKFKWIGEIIDGCVSGNKNKQGVMGKFDKIATSKIWGKPLAICIILLGLIASFIPASLFMTVGQSVPMLSAPAASALTAIGAPAWLISLICDSVISAIGFSISMAGFVVSVSFVFGLLEEIGYMARISYVFDNAMSKLGLQGKAIMPFLISFGCSMGGVAGTKVIDSWGQRVLTIAMSWAVPCAATWGVVGLMSSTFFGAGAPLVIIALFAAGFLHIIITSKIFGRSLVKSADKTGLIMELPPYHKPKWKNLFKFVLTRLGDVLFRAMKVIVLVAALFWLISYTADGNIESSIIYKIGIFLEPVTMFFGLRWQTFMAFVASAMGKEAALGVMSTLFSTGSGLVNSTMLHGAVSENLGTVLPSVISKAEALAFIFAFTFNIPCLMTISSTYQEIHSIKWTVKIALYYVASALVMSFLAYHIGLLIF